MVRAAKDEVVGVAEVAVWVVGAAVGISVGKRSVIPVDRRQSRARLFSDATEPSSASRRALDVCV